MADFTDLLGRLNRQKVEYVIIGGFAAILHGGTIVTEDVDICCRFTSGNLLRLQKAFSGFHPVHRITPKRLPLRLTAKNCRGLKNLYIETDWGVVDCLGEVLGIGDYAAVRKESVVVKLPFGSCRVLSLDALIKSKEAMNRPRDREAVIQLRAINAGKKA
jgi:hypothetical protein